MVHSSNQLGEPQNSTVPASPSSTTSSLSKEGTRWCLTVKNTFLSVETIVEEQLYSKSAPAACSGFELLKQHVSKKVDAKREEPSRFGVAEANSVSLSESPLEGLSDGVTPAASSTFVSSSSSPSPSSSFPSPSPSPSLSLSASTSRAPKRFASTKTTFETYSSVLLNALNEDPRTTLMVKNIPNKYTQQMLLETLSDFRGQFDFFYLPIDFKNKCNVGYAFINFIKPEYIVAFAQKFEGHTWEKFNSQKVCNITYARIQGKHGMIEHFRNSRLLIEDKTCRPLIFHSDGPSAGEEEEFPMGPDYPHNTPVSSSASGWRSTSGGSHPHHSRRQNEKSGATLSSETGGGGGGRKKG